MEIAFQGATLGQQGILVYAGTGVNCYGIDDKGNKGKWMEFYN